MSSVRVADANQLKRAWLEIGPGENPTKWRKVTDDITSKVTNNVLGYIGAGEFQGASIWYIRIIVEHKNGRRLEARFRLSVG